MNYKKISKNFQQNWKTYLFLLIVLVATTVASVISIILLNSAKIEIESQSQVHGKQVTIEQNPEYLRNLYTNELDVASSDDNDIISAMDAFKQYAKINCVKEINYMQYIKIYDTNLAIKDGDLSLIRKGTPYSYKLMTSTSDDFEQIFDDNNISLMDGEYPQNEMELVIPNQLLEVLNLTIGDEVTVVTEDNSREGTETNEGNEEFEMTIVGTYESIDEDVTYSNLIISSLNTFQEISNANTSVHAIYILDNYENVDEFVNAVAKIGIPTGYYINRHSSELEQLISPLKSLVALLQNVLIISVLLSCFITIIVTLRLIKNRDNELKMFRLYGYSKVSIIQNVINETIITWVVTIFISIGLTIVLIQPATTHLMNHYVEDTIYANNGTQNQEVTKSEAELIDEEETIFNQLFAKPITHLDLVFSFKSLFGILTIMMINVAIMLLVISVYINKMDLLQMLKEENE